MRHENKGCNSEFIHKDPDEADLRDKKHTTGQKGSVHISAACAAFHGSHKAVNHLESYLLVLVLL